MDEYGSFILELPHRTKILTETLLNKTSNKTTSEVSVNTSQLEWYSCLDITHPQLGHAITSEKFSLDHKSSSKTNE